MTTEPFVPRDRFPSHSATRLLLVLALGLLCWLPLRTIQSLIDERAARRESAQHEISSRWGGDQDLRGPVLTVPYEATASDEEGRAVREMRHALFLPETLAVAGELVPEVRRYGLFEQVVYTARLQFRGTFVRPAFDPWSGIAAGDVRWPGARLSVGIPDLRGLLAAGDLAWGERHAQFAPGPATADLFASGLHAEVPGLAGLAAGEPVPFAFELTVRGSDVIGFVPLGKETIVELASPWPSPSFQGAVLPERREISPRGFNARWRVSHLSRGYPQQWLPGARSERTGLTEGATQASAVDRSSFGVTLHLPADQYQQSTRAAKFGILFIVLTFLTVAGLASWRGVAVHPVHYALVGAALCLFYLLLLAISEHLGFGPAYALAALATVALVAGYSAAILARAAAAGLMAAALGALYGLLFVLLRVEDYALLIGSVALFAVLALVMFSTRRVRWS